MKWRDLPRSSNVHGAARPPRRRGAKRAAGGGLVAALIASIAIFVPEFRTYLGIDSEPQIEKGGRLLSYSEAPGDFTAAILGSTEAVWTEIFAEGAFPAAGGVYPKPTLELFDGAVVTECGAVGADAGPFYCPPEERIYIERNFYRDLAKTFQAPGDFGAAFVIAHEVGHHVQNVSGQLVRAYSVRLTSDDQRVNQISVRLELQADCYAGVWARRVDEATGALEEGDIQEGLRAAHQVGDDVLMRMANAPVRAEDFTHGSSAQRMRWFRRGFERGDVADCDTFGVDYGAL